MAKPWSDLSDQELTQLYLNASAENVQWAITSTHIERDQLTIEGWAIALHGTGGQARFLINGLPFEEVRYPLPSPDVADIFWNIPSAKAARFFCKTTIDERSYPDGFACVEFLDGHDHERARQRGWYLPHYQDDLPIPEGSRIRRVIGTPDSLNYLLGGAAIYKRIEHYLKQKFSKSFSDFGEILDWGCGCGRVARNFRWAKGSKLCGVDIDADNVAWCRKHLPHGQFLHIGPLPPLPFPDESFDLVIAISILGQITEEYQFAWLAELKRVAKKDAMVLVAIPGLTQIGLARPHPDLMRKVEEAGFLVTGRNHDLDEVMPEQTHYVSGIHSRNYLEKNRGDYFTILDIVDAIAANDDLVVMKNDKLDQEEPIAFSPKNPFSLPLRDYDVNPYIHPTVAKDGYAGHLIDIHGNDYVDFMCAWGTNLLGYGYGRVAEAAAEQLKRFSNLGLPYPQFNELMDLVRRIIPSAEEVRYGKNGSDACAGAVRLARHITGREKILYRGYHGFHDWYFASTDCPGIPSALRSTVISQAVLSPAAVDASFKRHPNQIAGIILNPLTGPISTKDDIHEVIDVVHRHGGLVIFDEMLSGFRVAPGGMQEVWGVKPDLSCFGKSIANGLPLSVLCGKSEYMRRLPETYYGMTFEGESVSIAAAYATLTEVIEKDVVGAFYSKGLIVRSDYRRLADIHGLNTSLTGYEPCMQLEFETQSDVPGRQLLWLMNQELVRNGIFTLGAFILCFSHSRADLRKLEKAVDGSMRVVRQAVDAGTTEGFLDERIRSSMEGIKSPANWRRVGANAPKGPVGSVRDLTTDAYLKASAENIQWLIDTHRVENGQLVIEGWALATSGQPEQAQFLINGLLFDEVHYPIPSFDIGEIFWNIPAAYAARFVCKTTIDWRRTYPEGFACLEFLPKGSDREQVRRRAWYLPHPINYMPIPEGEQVARVISTPDLANYLIGGAAIYKRVEDYLNQKFSKKFDDFGKILDWGCGCGRVARHFQRASGAKLYGVDIDGDNIAWCREHLSTGEFIETGLLPPLPFPEESFDLLLGISMLSQLNEDHQFVWLRELKRVAKRDAILMLSVQGASQIGLVVADRHRASSDHTYYLNVTQSREHIYKNWGRFFSIIEIVDAMAANDDMVVMRNDPPPL